MYNISSNDIVYKINCMSLTNLNFVPFFLNKHELPTKLVICIVTMFDSSNS